MEFERTAVLQSQVDVANGVRECRALTRQQFSLMLTRLHHSGIPACGVSPCTLQSYVTRQQVLPDKRCRDVVHEWHAGDDQRRHSSHEVAPRPPARHNVYPFCLVVAILSLTCLQHA